MSGSLCHNWCRRKELAAGDICPRSFRLFLLSKAAVVNASSANFVPCLTVCLQDGRSSAMLSPRVTVDVASLHVSLADILEAQFGASVS